MKNFFTPNRIALIIGCALFLLSAILLIKMKEMNAQLDELSQREAAITEELKNYN